MPVVALLATEVLTLEKLNIFVYLKYSTSVVLWGKIYNTPQRSTFY